MTAAPFMQLYIADYLGDTLHLTTEQHGAYLLLLMAMWRADGCLPNDPGKLARIARVSPRRWHIIADDVMAFFDVDGETITQKRLVEERKKAASISEKRSASGKLGGAAKSLKNNDVAVANAKQMPQHSQKPDTTYKISNPSSVAISDQSNLDDVEQKLRCAAGWQDAISPGLFVVGPILELIANGVDLETDILPVIKAKSARMSRPAGSWSYFVEPIREAHSKRIAAGRGVSKPSTPEADDKRWISRLDLARTRRLWSTSEWGPMPGQAGCIVPASLLQPDDGTGWSEYRAAA